MSYRVPRVLPFLLNSTSTFYFPLPPSFDTFSHVPFLPSLSFPPSVVPFLSFLLSVSSSRSRLLPLSLSLPFSLHLASLRDRCWAQATFRNTAEKSYRIADTISDSARSLAKYLLPIRYLLEMLRSRLGSASLPPFPYVQGGKGSVLSFFPASYIFLHIRILTFILFHVRSNELLDSRNFLSFSLTR